MTEEKVIEMIKEVIESRFTSLYLGKNFVVVYDEEADTAYADLQRNEIHVGKNMFLNTIKNSRMSMEKIDLELLITTVLFHEIAHGIYTSKVYSNKWGLLSNYRISKYFPNAFELGNLIEDARIEYYASAWKVKGVDFKYSVRKLVGYNKKTFKPKTIQEYIFGLARFNHATYEGDEKRIKDLYQIFDNAKFIHNLVHESVLSWDEQCNIAPIIKSIREWTEEVINNFHKQNSGIIITDKNIKDLERKIMSYNYDYNSESLPKDLVEIGKKLKDIYTTSSLTDIDIVNKQKDYIKSKLFDVVFKNKQRAIVIVKEEAKKIAATEGKTVYEVLRDMLCFVGSEKYAHVAELIKFVEDDLGISLSKGEI